MAIQIGVSIQSEGGLNITEYRRLSIQQDLFGHHFFEVVVPFDKLESNIAGFLNKAHKDYCGKSLMIRFANDPEAENPTSEKIDFKFKGVVTDISLGNSSDLIGFFVIRGYSPTFLLEDGVQRRTFRDQTLSDIYNKVLGDYDANLVSPKISPKDSKPAKYIVQYKESNFTFLNRLAAEYGEWFYYDGENLCLQQPEDNTIEYKIDGNRNSFNMDISLRPLKFKMFEYNPVENKKFNGDSDSQEVKGVHGHPFGSFALDESNRLFKQASFVKADAPIKNQSELDEEIKLLKSNQAAGLIIFRGSGDNPNVTVGKVINVSGEGLGRFNVNKNESFGKYRIVRITHYVDKAGNYTHSFEAVPFSLEVPPSNPVYMPAIGQPELAEVIDINDKDKLGRVRVKFFWPNDDEKEKESDWIRIVTQYSSNGKGIMFNPEKGSQVLVGYTNNLAEHPVIIGNLFHMKNDAGGKYTHPDNTIKSIQTIAGNKIVIHDKKGGEKIVISNGNKEDTQIEIQFIGPGMININTQGSVNLTGKDISLTAQNSVNIQAKDVSINASNNLNASASSNANITASSKLNMNGGSKAVLQSADVDIIG
jgi:type VI secretion system secreted protein VgrG